MPLTGCRSIAEQKYCSLSKSVDNGESGAHYKWLDKAGGSLILSYPVCNKQVL